MFTGGQYWIPDSAFETILQENGYQETSDPQPGDLVVYRRGRSFAHVGIVRYRTAGLPVMVEGKWGFGGVYLHPVERAVYGTVFGYCRSPRRGHLLNGLGTAGSASARKSDAIPEDETE